MNFLQNKPVGFSGTAYISDPYSLLSPTFGMVSYRLFSEIKIVAI